MQTAVRHRLRLDAACVLVLLLLVGAVYFSTIRTGHNWGGDFSGYILHARNLVSGRPYAQTGYLYTTEAPMHAPPSYPPLFPLLLAPVYHAYGLNYFVFKLLVQALLLLALLPYYVLARIRGIMPVPAALAMSAFALSAILLEIKESIVPEGLYLLFAGVALVAMTLLYREGWDKAKPIRAALIIIGLIMLAYTARATGLTLIIAFGGYELWHARRIRWFGVLVAGGVVAALLLYTFFIYDGRGYGREFTMRNVRFYLDNAIYYTRSAATLWGGAPRVVRYPISGMFLVLVAIAFVHSMRRPTPMEFYFLACIGVVLAYASARTDRYLLPAFPLMLIYAVEAVQGLTARLLPQHRRLALTAAFAVLVIGIAFNLRAMKTGPETEGPEKPSFLETCAFIKQNTAPGSIFLFWNPRVLALYTNRTAAWYVHTSDDARFDRFVKNTRASYVLAYRGSTDSIDWLEPHIQHQPAEFKKVYANVDFALYKISD